ncbi:hypothetical protein HYY74_06925 [Candidatus Woesearchaeota archaeon]|nr:hypothetical protein [Candidatus Woesearchaeota archaeon]
MGFCIRGFWICALALILAGCAAQEPRVDYLGPSDNLSISYSSTSFAFSPYRETIEVFPNGSISYRYYELDRAGQVVNITAASDKELGADYDRLISIITEQPDFFSVPKELRNEQCRDGAEEELAIEYNGRFHSVSASCPENAKFTSITNFLNGLFAANR